MELSLIRWHGFEMDVLGSMVYQGGFAEHVIGESPDVFNDERNRDIFRAMQMIVEDGKELTLPELVDRLHESVPVEHLVDVAHHRTSSSMASMYSLKRLKRGYRERKLKEYTERLHLASTQEERAELLAEIEDLNRDSEVEVEDRTTLADMANVGFDVLFSDHTFVKTGIEGLDESIIGIEDTQLLVIGASPGMGKTTLGWQIGVGVGNTVFFSMEMATSDMYARELSRLAEVPVAKIKMRNLSDAEWKRVMDAQEKLKLTTGVTVYGKAYPYHVLLSKIRAEVRRGVKLVVVDYVQLVQGAPGKTENEQLTAITTDLKQIALNNHVPVLLLSQLTKSSYGTGERPGLNALRGSGSIAQNADIVITIHEDSNKVIRVYLEKGRNLKTGPVNLQFDGRNSRFITPATKKFCDTAVFDDRAIEYFHD
jgi:replicative DNA helicase